MSQMENKLTARPSEFEAMLEFMEKMIREKGNSEVLPLFGDKQILIQA